MAASDPTIAQLQAPLPRAAHEGKAGALLELLSVPAKPEDVKLLLGKFRASAGRLAITFWARARFEHKEQDGKKNGEGKKGKGSGDALTPFVSVDVLDETAKFEWLGAWQHFELTGVWTQHEVSVVVPIARQSHMLDVSLAVGGSQSGLHLDDVSITAPQAAQSLSTMTAVAKPAAASPADESAAKALAEAIVAAENTTGVTLPRSQIFATGFEAGEPTVQLTAGDSKTAQLQAPLPRAAHEGKAGALFELLSVPAKPEDVKLLLGKFRASAGRLAITFWARALSQEVPGTTSPGDMSTPFVSVDVLDETAGFEWLGAWQHFALTGVWTQHEVSVVVAIARQSHMLDVSLVVGGAKSGLLLDDVSITVPDAGALQLLVKHGFEPNSTATSRLTMSSSGAGHAKVQFHSSRAARTDASGALINVWQAPKARSGVTRGPGHARPLSLSALPLACRCLRMCASLSVGSPRAPATSRSRSGRARLDTQRRRCRCARPAVRRRGVSVLALPWWRLGHI